MAFISILYEMTQSEYKKIDQTSPVSSILQSPPPGCADNLALETAFSS